jgi:DNA-binding SARP family transcriptional activator
MTNRLNVTIHQLNQTIKNEFQIESCVLNKEGIIRLQAHFFGNIDVEDYLTLGRVADQLLISDKEVSIEYYEKAYKIYGTLAPDFLYVDWLNEIREDLLNKQIIILDKLGKNAFDKKSYERAEYFYQLGLELAPHREQIYHELIKSLIELGKKKEAANCYKKYEKMCKEELGSEPLKIIFQ